MNYLSKYVEGLHFLSEFDKDFNEQNLGLEELEDIVKHNCNLIDPNTDLKLRNFIHNMSIGMLKQVSDKQIAHCCHTISDSFLCNYNQTNACKDYPLAITIGNVFYKGKNIYELNREKLKEVINKGHDLQEQLPVHVWLTLPNMVVVDLTIILSLIYKDLMPMSACDKSPVLFWNEADNSDFYYEPILVDNHFAHRVDQLSPKP